MTLCRCASVPVTSDPSLRSELHLNAAVDGAIDHEAIRTHQHLEQNNLFFGEHQHFYFKETKHGFNRVRMKRSKVLRYSRGILPPLAETLSLRQWIISDLQGKLPGHRNALQDVNEDLVLFILGVILSWSNLRHMDAHG